MNRTPDHMTKLAPIPRTSCPAERTAVSQIIVSGADRAQSLADNSTLQTREDDLLPAFIIWNIQTHKTARHTLFAHWLCA
ncbi:hypothetical protein TH25_01745 [Thalassospira profundimaris]|uniref:Uncharacterized protein n=1 Tax=Thalassospira profundimaris TaxID=502049 RepID=A0A367XK98_9PROT|nr:hypothetical protein [Thalassospira profundimaris]RCK54087.1 hypothetical protein TH25_01745 [Thalassospira profundimaris]